MSLQKLRVSKNGRYLEFQDGTPFFYLGDTAWGLFAAVGPDEVKAYLEDRVQKGFTVIQAILMYEEECEVEEYALKDYSGYGEPYVLDRDPTRPNEEYFRHVDEVVDLMEAMGLYLALSPTWGDFVLPNPWRAEAAARKPAIFDPDNAYVFGKFLGSRYREKPIIWVLGGDRPADGVEDIWNAMARGLREGDRGSHLMTFHTCFDTQMVPIPSSSTWFHHSGWLDFNMIQSGHLWDTKNFKYVSHDYGLLPVKPVLDGEPRYENIIETFWNANDRRITPFKVRQAAYWAMLSGAAGHTYGCNDVWQFYDTDKVPQYNANTPWKKALQNEGAVQMGVLRKLMEAYPWYGMIPDQRLVASKHREDEGHIRAARAEDGSFALLYTPLGDTVEVRTDGLAGESLRAGWFNPRSGDVTPAGEFKKEPVLRFQAPGGEAMLDSDWVLILEGANKAETAFRLERTTGKAVL